MNYGLYLSASGVLTNLYRQDVFANNLANAHTVGFKPEIPTVAQREPESVEGDFAADLSNELLDRLGGGVLAGRQRISFGQGSLERTENPLDVALRDPAQFFAVSATDRQTGQSSVQLTRDGRFQRDPQGYLATVIGNHRVLDTDDQPIPLGPGPALIDSTARVQQNGEAIAQIQIATVSDEERLAKQGGSLLKIDGPSSLRQPVTQPTVAPGYIESSGTDPIKTLMSLIESTKSVTANGNMIRYHDQLMDKAVNVLGRVSA